MRKCGARAQGNPACASDYNLPPSLREVPRRGGGSSCPPCAREGGAAELRRKGCLAINSLQKASLVMPFAPRFAAYAAYGGEHVRYADSPCGASAYVRTKKLPFQRQFRDRGGTPLWCRRDSEPPRAILLPNSGGEENQTQSASGCWVFLNLTEFLFELTKRNS